ncbi:unnamed protein product, partial [Phaeothamnion confervicola]
RRSLAVWREDSPATPWSIRSVAGQCPRLRRQSRRTPSCSQPVASQGPIPGGRTLSASDMREPHTFQPSLQLVVLLYGSAWPRRSQPITAVRAAKAKKLVKL